MRSIAFFNNKGGVGKTSLVYHLAWMYADLGLSVVAADLDPQSNLSAMFLDEDSLEPLWPEGEHPCTILGAVQPLLRGIGDVSPPHVVDIADNVGLITGDLGLSSFEDELSLQWAKCLDGQERAFRVISAFYRIVLMACQARGAQLALIDVGPNLGALNRAALIAADYVVVPLAPDLFSLQGLRNLGPTLRQWRYGWQRRVGESPQGLTLPRGSMTPGGYITMQHGVRLDRPVTAYRKWLDRIPKEYREAVLGDGDPGAMPVESDPFCLATLKHYRSLMPMAMDARKPVFFLKPADGAIGSHLSAAKKAYGDFEQLARQIASQCDFGPDLP